MSPVPFNGQNYQKQKRPGTSDQSLFRLRNKFRKILLLAMNFYSFITWPNLCEPVHDIINYSTSICPFRSGKCGMEGKKLQKIEYLESEKSFFDEIKYIFYSLWRAIIWWKNRNLIKNSGHKLYVLALANFSANDFCVTSRVKRYLSDCGDEIKVLWEKGCEREEEITEEKK